MKRFSIFVLICALLSACSAEGSYTLTSPDGKVVAEVNVGNGTTYSVAFDQKSILSPSAVAIRLEDGTILGSGKVRRVSHYSHSESITPQFYFKSTIEDNYNALKVEFADRSAIEFRAYNDGVAYRFITNRRSEFTVQNEVVAFDFAKPYADLDNFIYSEFISFLPPSGPRSPRNTTDLWSSQTLMTML